MATMVRVRRAGPADVPLLLPLVAAYWSFEGLAGFEERRVGAQLTRLLGEPRLGAGWLGFAGDKPAGYLLAVYVFSLEHLGLTAEIDELFVAPSTRGHGLGAALLAQAEAAFQAAGCTCVSLQLARGNQAGRAFYHRGGYRERAGYELLDKILNSG
jgi:ribosomal protein S18 acetylase RimI-like enzyme